MTQLATKPRRTAPVAQSPVLPDPAVAAVLRDAAFILQMTRRVKDAILDAKPLPAPVKA
ncbi:MAG TPA: hypothetical protein VKE74_20075 [Gemmataceae bacterium]|nr:hypothetical protein [Gemmataceae bacterium]